MNDVTVVTSVTYPSPESLALVADVQYHEPYLSAALNRKFRGIVDPGFYAGFFPKPGGGMNLLITSVDGDKTAGAASVDIGEFYQVTIQQRKDISLALSAGKKYAIVLKGRYGSKPLPNMLDQKILIFAFRSPHIEHFSRSFNSSGVNPEATYFLISLRHCIFRG